MKLLSKALDTLYTLTFQVSVLLLIMSVAYLIVQAFQRG
jgi:hypothetical protein